MKIEAVLRCVAISIIGLLCAQADSNAQPIAAYPTKPIRIIVPYAPGGPSDMLGRTVGQALTEAWGQPAIIENRAGAAGDVGTSAAANAPADGYTLNIVGISFAVAPSVKRKLEYDPDRDFVPITLVATINNLLVVNPSLPVKSVKELIAVARMRPNEVTFMSGGVGGGQHLAGELFNSMAGIKMTHVPYKGTGPGLTALLGGEVVSAFADMVATLPIVKSGRLRALAVTGPQRSPLIPELPTIAEAGLPGYAVTLWFGLLAPAGTRADIVSRINSAIAKGLTKPQTKERLTMLGADPVGNTPEQFRVFLGAEREKWSKTVKAAGIQGE
jgi:tripartite-type tricarboxylate transporter receptor subunit TctC